MKPLSSPLLSKELQNFAFLAATNCVVDAAYLAIFNPSTSYYSQACSGNLDTDTELCGRTLHGMVSEQLTEIHNIQDHPDLNHMPCFSGYDYLAALRLKLCGQELEGILVILNKEEIDLDEAKRKSITLIADMAVAQINARKEKQKVKELEDKVREVTRIGRLGYWETDLRTGHLFWSEEIYRICEKEPGKGYVTREEFYDLVHPEDRAALIAQREAIIAGRHGELDIEHRLVLPDGTLKWVHARGYMVHDAAGEPVKFQGTIKEITDQKKQEQDAEQNTQFIASTLDNVPLGIVVNKISTGELTYVNPYFTSLFGWKMDELQTIEKSLEAMLPDPQVRAKRMEQVGEYLESGESRIMEWKEIEAFNREGNKLIININTIPLYEQDLVISTVADETEAHRTQRELHSSNERFRIVSKAAWETIYDWDILNGIQTWSENSYINLDKKGSAGAASNYRQWLIRLHPEDRNRVLKTLEDALNSDSNEWAASYRFRADNGKDYLFLKDRGHIIRNQAGEAVRVVGAVLNVTEELHREKQLKVFESAIENTRDAILITEIQPGKEPKDYPICYCNRAWERLSGYTREEIIGQSPSILHGPLTNPSEILKAVKNISEERTADIDIVNYKKNGDPYWVNLSISPVIDQKGDTTHYISIQREISLQKAEILNRELIQRISQIFSRHTSVKEALESTVLQLAEAMPIALAELRLVNEYTGELELQATYADSPEMLSLLEAALVVDYREGHGIHKQIFDEISDIAITDLEHESRDPEHQMFRDLGLKSAYGIPLLANKKMTGTLVVYSKYSARNYQEIMDRRMQDLPYYLGSEIHRKQLLEQMNLIFSSVPDLICTADSNGFVKKINDTVYTHFGYQPEEIVGRHFTEFVYEEDLERAIEEFQNVVAGTPTPYFEVRYMHKSGEPKWLAWSINVPDQGGDIFCVAKDISDKKDREREVIELNERLQYNNEMLAASNAELEQFAYVASHDLQEPLRMISGFLTQLSKKYDDILDDKGKTYIHYAVDGAKRMRKIIMDLLEYSRLGRSEEIRTQVDVNKVLEQIESMYGILINRTGAKIVKPDNLPTVYTYQVLLFQVFQNLIDNALKYRKEDVPPEITIDYADRGEHYEFSVADNGIGISEDYYEKIFIIFQRLHTKSEYNGTGMGLTTTRKILEVLGGNISVSSEPGKGSKFTFSIQKNCSKELSEAENLDAI